MKTLRKNRISKAGPPVGIALAALLLLGMSLAVPSYSQEAPKPGTAPAIWHHRDVPFGDTIKIQGWNLEPSTDYDVVVIWPDGSIVWGDGDCPEGTETCWDVITTDEAGEILNTPYTYLAPELAGNYQVRLYPSPWEGDLEQPPIAETTFPNWAGK